MYHMTWYMYYYNDHRDSHNHASDVTNMQYNATISKSVTYENFTLKEARLSTTQQPVPTAAADNMKIQNNPSYLTVDSSNPQVKPETEDYTVIEEDVYFNVQ